jgi:DNA-binding transcriptional regulator YiaG
MSALVERVKMSRQFPPSLAKAIREAAGVSQQQVAAELGVHRVSVARWEGGVRSPRGPLRTAYVDLLRQLQEVSG